MDARTSIMLDNAICRGYLGCPPDCSDTTQYIEYWQRLKYILSQLRTKGDFELLAMKACCATSQQGAPVQPPGTTATSCASTVLKWICDHADVIAAAQAVVIGAVGVFGPATPWLTYIGEGLNATLGYCTSTDANGALKVTCQLTPYLKQFTDWIHAAVQTLPALSGVGSAVDSLGGLLGAASPCCTTLPTADPGLPPLPATSCYRDGNGKIFCRTGYGDWAEVSSIPVGASIA